MPSAEDCRPEASKRSALDALALLGVNPGADPRLIDFALSRVHAFAFFLAGALATESFRLSEGGRGPFLVFPGGKGDPGPRT